MSRAARHRTRRLPGFFAILAGVAPAPALAGAEVAGPAARGPAVAGASCLRIDDAQERLACFDRAVGDAVRGASGTSAPSEAASTPVTPPPGTVPSGTPGGGPAPLPADGAVADTLPGPAPARIDTAWGLLPDSRTAYVRLHRPNYILFARYSTDKNEAPYEPLFDAFAEDGDFGNVEAKFQLSLKGRLLASEDRRWGLWFAYTQQNHWQVFESDISRPFRETNYEPEVFGTYHPDVDLGGWRWNLLAFGYNHQSNGRADPISRSWDRLFVEAAVERGDWVLSARAWTRIRLGEYEDDNPDIVDYYGNAELNALYRWRGHTFTLMGRGNPATGKGAAQFTWATRPLLGPLRGYVQVFTGYGESMIDYDWRQTTIGAGISVNERF